MLRYVMLTAIPPPATLNSSTVAGSEHALPDISDAQTLDQQENMQIKGTQARHMVMQKLMRRTEVKLADMFESSFCQIKLEFVFCTR